uniref:SLC26A5 protein n=1 Tax=Fopius arisanus TaxID=64838 RepID=A0A0C9QAC9_9HYME
MLHSEIYQCLRTSLSSQRRLSPRFPFVRYNHSTCTQMKSLSHLHSSQLAMYVLRLGVISSLLSETLVSGFTTAAAVHVFTSQIKDLLGIHLPRRRGLLKVVYVSIYSTF